MKIEDISKSGTVTIPATEYFELLQNKDDYSEFINNKKMRFIFNEHTSYINTLKHYHGIDSISDTVYADLITSDDTVEPPMVLLKELEEINKTNFEKYTAELDKIRSSYNSKLKTEQLKNRIVLDVIDEFIKNQYEKSYTWFNNKSVLYDKMAEFNKSLQQKMIEKNLWDI